MLRKGVVGSFSFLRRWPAVGYGAQFRHHRRVLRLPCFQLQGGKYQETASTKQKNSLLSQLHWLPVFSRIITSAPTMSDLALLFCAPYNEAEYLHFLLYLHFVLPSSDSFGDAVAEIGIGQVFSGQCTTASLQVPRTSCSVVCQTVCGYSSNVSQPGRL